MYERILQLAISQLEFMGTLSFGDYTIEKLYLGTFIREGNNRIGVFADGSYFINGYRAKDRFETAVQQNLFVFVDFIASKFQELHKKCSDYDFKISRLETEKKELEEKISEKVVEETQENLSELTF